MVLVLLADLALVVLRCAGLLLDRLEDDAKQIRIVIAALVQQHGRDALQAHARVHALCRQVDQGSVVLALKLHEDIVPDLEHIRVVHVDEFWTLSPSDAVVMDLRARTTRTRVAHLPEIVLHVKGQDSRVRQILLPDPLGILIHRHSGLLLVASIVRGIQPIGVQVVHLGQQFPSPIDRLLLEVVAKRPIAKHLKKSVVVNVLADILEVVVLATCSDAFLRVCGALQLCKGMAGVDLSNKNRLELVHACVDEQQCGVVVRHHW
mmetsp:Transcript_138675/g.351506  ORF Transcript_138675/g.351506 Transcript_138675/m.351506 type:complete len:263 (-) Transcript_138675:331-1119(-)